MIIDAHLDLAYNAINLGRDLTIAVEAGRERAAERAAAWIRDAGTLTTTLAEIRAHGPAIVCGTIFILPADAATTLDGTAYRTPAEARDQAWEQLRWYRAQHDAGNLRMVASRAELERIGAETTPGPPGLVLLMEGADGLLTPGDLAEWAAAGLRWLGPAWGATRYSGGTGAPGPLTPLGVELLGEMDRLGVALDASHLAEESFWQAVRGFKGPIASSHANCRALVPGDRQLSDEMIRAIIDRDGVIGMVLFNKMLRGDWDGRKESVTLADVLRHVEHVCELAGDSRHVALGSDFDGGFGLEGIPAELTRWGDLPLIGRALAAAGWSEGDVANLMGGSWRRWLGRVLP